MFNLLKLSFTVLLAFLFVGAQARQTIRKVNGEKIKTKQLDEVIKHTMDSLGIPGLSIAIINNGKIKYLGTFGVMDKVTRQPVDGNTIFEAVWDELFTYRQQCRLPVFLQF